MAVAVPTSRHRAWLSCGSCRCRSCRNSFACPELRVRREAGQPAPLRAPSQVSWCPPQFGFARSKFLLCKARHAPSPRITCRKASAALIQRLLNKCVLGSKATDAAARAPGATQRQHPGHDGTDSYISRVLCHLQELFRRVADAQRVAGVSKSNHRGLVRLVPPENGRKIEIDVDLSAAAALVFAFDP